MSFGTKLSKRTATCVIIRKLVGQEATVPLLASGSQTTLALPGDQEAATSQP